MASGFVLKEPNNILKKIDKNSNADAKKNRAIH